MKTLDVLFVGKETFEQMYKISCCSHISEGKSIPGTIFHLNKEYIITGFIGDGHNGFHTFFGCEVVDLSIYDRPLKPLSYGIHGAEVDAGSRERGYTGLLIRFGPRALVCLDQVDFKASHELKQLTLF